MKVLLALLLALGQGASAAVTLYNGDQWGAESSASIEPTSTEDYLPPPVYTGLPAYDPTRLEPPAPPEEAVKQLAINIPLDPNAAGYRLSKQQKGNFLGFSIELSVATSLMGQHGKTINPIFLNYMANIRNRAGCGPVIRVGGNTQESSTLVFDKDAATTEKIKIHNYSPTQTPIINYTPELLYVMANISSLIDVEWYFGLSFNETSVTTQNPNVPLAAEWIQRILGSNLRGLALGNEPDLYTDHRKRPEGWNMDNYLSEFADMRDMIVQKPGVQYPDVFVGPSVCCNREGFLLKDVLDAGWLDQNIDYVTSISVQRYPANNCQIGGKIVDPQEIFHEYLKHSNPQWLTSEYLDGSAKALEKGKDIVMLEFNTASCGGFPGLSDSFGAAMWIADWALQLAWGNFSAALMHVGGQNVYYNPFTPPPFNMLSTRQWTTGSVYYSTLLVAEAFGQTNTSQVVDYFTEYSDELHPAYLIYEEGVPARAVLFNYVTDPSGGHDYTATIKVEGSDVIGDKVAVRYLRANSAAEQYDITWAGQTLGHSFTSDGRLYGKLETLYFDCHDGECNINVPAPSIALVFFNDHFLEESTPPADAPISFATTIVGTGAAAIDPEVLRTANGIDLPYGVYGSAGRNKFAESDALPQARLQIGLGILAITIALAFTRIVQL